MVVLKPDIIARVSLFATAQGGRTTTIPSVQYGCPLFIAGEGFDCRLLLDQVGISLAPGTTADVPIKFLFIDLVRSRLAVGVQFKLWEGGTFAEGKILQVLAPSPEDR